VYTFQLIDLCISENDVSSHQTLLKFSGFIKVDQGCSIQSNNIKIEGGEQEVTQYIPLDINGSNGSILRPSVQSTVMHFNQIVKSQF
jgi:hypothetical protein